MNPVPWRSIPRHFGIGFRSFFRGFRYIYRESLWGHLILPSFLSVFVGIGLVVLYAFLISELFESVAITIISLFDEDPVQIGSTLEASILAISVVFGFVLTLLSYRAAASVVVIPFLGTLLEDVETRELGRPVDVPLKKDVLNTLYGIWTSLKFGVIGLIVFVVSLFLGPFKLVVDLIANSYFMGRGSFDMIIEKQVDSRAERKPYLKRFRWEILGNGVAFVLMLIVPLLGLFLAPACSVVGLALTVYGEEEVRSRLDYS